MPRRSAQLPYQVNVRVDPDTYRRLSQAADALEMPISEWIRGLVAEHLPKLEARARRTPKPAR